MKIKITKKPEWLRLPDRLPSRLYDLGEDGATQSLLSLFMECRQKAGLYLQGWESRYHSAALLHGALGHGMLEYAYLDIAAGKLKSIPTLQQARKYADRAKAQWLKDSAKPSTEALLDAETSLAVLEQTLPRYFDFWRKDLGGVKWIQLEEQFCSQFAGVSLRGKRDGRFAVRKESWLLENKFKSMVNEGDLQDALSIDFQVMLYLSTLRKDSGKCPDGMLYNIIRRPGMRPHKDEPVPKYAKRVAEDIEARPEFYFTRMEIPVGPKDLDAFEADLNGLIADYTGWIAGKIPHYKNPNSCLGKYGKCKYVGVCTKGDYSGLAKRKVLFQELSDY